MFRLLIDTIYNFLNSGLQDKLEIEVLRKHILLNLIGLLGIAFIIPFGVFALLAENYFIATADFTVLVLLIICGIYLRKTNDLILTSYVVTTFMGSLFIILMFSEQGPNGGHVWSYLYPLAVLFLLGRKNGAIASFIYLSIIVSLFVVFSSDVEFANYFKFRFIGSFIALTLTTYLFESVRASTEKRMLEAKELAEQSDKLRSEFLAQMSHEIRTPVSTILNFSALLKMDKQKTLSDDEKLYYGSIENAANRLIRTIDLILNMSDIEVGAYVPNFEEIDIVQTVISPACLELREAAEKKRLELLCIDHVKKNILVKVDKYTITQSIVNLIDNAIKYTNDGKIIVSYSEINGKYAIEVADTGVGIAEEFIPRIFEKFSQEEQGYSRRFDGNGLGLALVKKYCDINNAEISVTSTKDKGTKFTILLNN